ncbi:MAG TPA: glycosyltransferase family 1 protein, partial [Bacteroidales bacterium]|nr:glycosyltransferase family 1 protein [Bacteroidales bacterium]
MRIAVNTRLLLKDRLDGIGWFTYETMRRITGDHPGHDFIFLFDRPYHPGFIFSENVKPVVAGPPSRHPVLWYLWFEHTVPGLLKREKADVFISPDGYLSLNTRVPSVPVIHDINFLHRPGDLPLSSRWYYNHYFPKFAAAAKKIGTVSEYSKSDICGNYNIDPSKIDVLYNGVNENYVPLDALEKAKIRTELTGGLPYFVYIGTLHPRKNIPGMLKGYDIFRKRYGKPYRMVIIGEKMFMTEEIDRTLAAMEYKEEVIFTGRLDPEKLHRVLASAVAMTFVPFFEGFGIPMIEAMKCGIPVIASNATSLPEISGGAALHCAPEDIETMAGNMLRVAGDTSLQKELAEKG